MRNSIGNSIVVISSNIPDAIRRVSGSFISIPSAENNVATINDTTREMKILGCFRPKSTSAVADNEEFLPFEKFLGRDVLLLRIAGLVSMKSVFKTDEIDKSSKWEAVPFALGISHILFAALCEFRTILQVWSSNPNYAIEVFAPMLSAILIAVKGIRLWFWRSALRRLLKTLSSMWAESEHRTKIRKQIIQSAKGSFKVGKYYNAMILVLVSNYAIKPYIMLLEYHLRKNQTSEPYDYSVTVYPTTYPFPTNSFTSYIICVTWEQFIFFFFVLYWMAADGLFAQLTTHTAIQFRVLYHDLKYIAADKISERELVHRLMMITKRHHELYTCCKTIENIFNPVLFLMMLLTAANMCFCAFRIDQEISQSNWDGVIKYLIHMVTLIIQAVIYCGYADKLTQQSSTITRAAYNCQWTERCKKFKMQLLMIMLRSQKEFKCTAYGIFYINLSQITAIVNTAASYFTILKSMT